MVNNWEILDFITSKSMSFCIQYDISIGSFHLSVSVLHLCCGNLCIPWNVELQICVECQLTWVVLLMVDDIILCKSIMYQNYCEIRLNSYTYYATFVKIYISLNFIMLWSYLKFFYKKGNIIIMKARTWSKKASFISCYPHSNLTSQNLFISRHDTTKWNRKEM